MRTKIFAKWIYPVSSPPIKNGTLIIENGIITHIFSEDTINSTSTPCDETIDLPEHIVMPGLINTHTHLELSHLKGQINNNLSFTDWIREVIKLSQSGKTDKTTAAISSELDKLLKQGTTTVADISLTGLSYHPLLASKIRAVLFHEVIGFPKNSTKECLAALEKRLQATPSSNLLSPGLSPHSVYSCSPDLITATATLAKEKNLPLTIHAAETEEEKQFTYSGTGPFKQLLTDLNKWDNSWRPPYRSPIFSLHGQKALNTTLLVHCNKVTMDDSMLAKKNNASIAFCPLSNNWFQRTAPYPLVEFLQAGINCSLGTDSLASNNQLNIFDEMKEVKRQFPEIPYETIIKMGTINGAKALSLSNLIGSIEEGKKADLIAYKTIKIAPPNTLAEYIVTETHTVTMTLIQGRVI